MKSKETKIILSESEAQLFINYINYKISHVSEQIELDNANMVNSYNEAMKRKYKDKLEKNYRLLSWYKNIKSKLKGVK